MKGTPKMPRCGFSGYVNNVLKFYGIKQYHGVNVLDNEVLREAIKSFSNWPTIPQLYVKGNFIGKSISTQSLGGCDIVKEMHADGSFEDLLIKEKIISK